jgi:hypothetical protein
MNTFTAFSKKYFDCWIQNCNCAIPHPNDDIRFWEFCVSYSRVKKKNRMHVERFKEVLLYSPYFNLEIYESVEYFSKRFEIFFELYDLGLIKYNLPHQIIKF